MKITWIGHSCFLLESAPPLPGGAGMRVITDPYRHGAYNGGVKYRAFGDQADVVTVSHAHPDHDFSAGVGGNPVTVSSPGRHAIRGTEFLGVSAFHDSDHGAQRGKVIVFRIVLDGVAVVHLGDLGHIPGPEIVKALKPVDILLLPVGGNFTVGPKEAGAVIMALSPRLTIPMHYSTPGVDFSIHGVEDFLEGKSDVIRSVSSSIELSADSVPMGVLVLTARNLP